MAAEGGVGRDSYHLSGMKNDRVGLRVLDDPPATD